MKTLTTFIVFGVCLLTVGVLLGQPIFDHATHAEQDLACEDCHLPPSANAGYEAAMPDKGYCLDCHDEDELPIIGDRPISHVGDYRHGHQFDARGTGGDCAVCHYESESCTACHHGENVDFLAHDRNWRYTHPLTRFKGTEDCAACHNTRNFCQDCHMQNGIKPGDHFVSGWTTVHAQEARLDLTTCMQCHGGPEPVCKSCHN